MDSERTAGLVLAAGAGRRMGRAKALVRDAHGTPWVVRAVRVLLAAGCRPVTVVIGADAAAVRSVLEAHPAEVVEAADWSDGMGASLRAGLRAVRGDRANSAATAVVITPVDVPGLTADVVRRVGVGADRRSLVRATYGGAPGHPVLIGRAHWAGVIEEARGDEGARGYLLAHGVTSIECADLADGRDVDTPEALPPGHALGNHGTGGPS